MACPHGAPRPPGKGGRFAQRCVDCAPLYVKFRKSNTDAALWKERKKRKQVHTEVPDPVQERRDSVQVFRDPDNTHDDDDDTQPFDAPDCDPEEVSQTGQVGKCDPEEVSQTRQVGRCDPSIVHRGK